MAFEGAAVWLCTGEKAERPEGAIGEAATAEPGVAAAGRVRVAGCGDAAGVGTAVLLENECSC